MSLSCHCDYDILPNTWYWEDSERKTMVFRRRRLKCCSCKGIINTGDAVTEYFRFMTLDEDSVDYEIHGERKPLASLFECEECYDLREALEELGYCVNLGEYMKELIREHNELREQLK